MTEFIEWLEGRVAAVNALEKKARAILDGAQSGDYSEVMRNKAELLASLADDGEGLLSSLPADKRAPVRARLSRFSSSAETALNLGSVWFMSALLYPEDHQEGQPNDLEAFFNSLG